MVQEIGQIIVRNWDIREFRVRVNFQSGIRQVRVPVWCVMTPIWGLSNPIRQVVPLISHIHLYSPHHSHLHPPSLSFSSTSQPSLQNTKWSHPSLSLHGRIMSWHRVQHTPSTASTQDFLSSLHSHDYQLTPECRFSFRRASLYDRPPSASSLWELKSKVTSSHSHRWDSTNRWVESQHRVRRPSTASTYSSNLTRSRTPSASPNSLGHGLQVHLQTRSITASKCISKPARLWAASASPNSLYYSLGVYLWVHSIFIFRRTSNRSQAAPAASPDIPCGDG